VHSRSLDSSQKRALSAETAHAIRERADDSAEDEERRAPGHVVQGALVDFRPTEIPEAEHGQRQRGGGETPSHAQLDRDQRDREHVEERDDVGRVLHADTQEEHPGEQKDGDGEHQRPPRADGP
jgi:hypothetical protein